MIKRVFLTLIVIILPVAFSQMVHAGNASSPWIIDQYTKSRLFVGGYDKENKILHLGWHLTLKDGWKTYWRTPGEAGLPPRWSWTKNKNINSIAVNWPVPELLHIFDMDTYIYHNEVILPIEVQVQNENEALSIALDLDYMICEEICIPLEGRYQLDIDTVGKVKISLFQKAQLDRYRGRVPAKISGDGTTVKADPKGNESLLITLPDHLSSVKNIIVEGADGMLFGKAVAIQSQDKKRFKVHYMGEPLLEGQALTLTLLNKKAPAQEMTVSLQP